MTKKAAGAAPQTEKKDGEASRQAVPDAACGEAVRAFLDDWNADRPAEAAGGSYATTVRDRWDKQSFDAIPDGVVFAAGWAFIFDDGRFIGASTLDQMLPTFVDKGQLIQMAATD